MKIDLCKQPSQLKQSGEPFDLLALFSIHNKRYRQRNASRRFRQTFRGHLREIFHSNKYYCNDSGIGWGFSTFKEFVDCIINMGYSELEQIKDLQFGRINTSKSFCETNVRFATCSEHALNRRKYSISRTGEPTSSVMKGVSFNSRTRKYRATITINGKAKYIGEYFDELQAGIVWDNWAIALHGEGNVSTNSSLGLITKWLNNDNNKLMTTTDFIASLKSGREKI